MHPTSTAPPDASFRWGFEPLTPDITLAMRNKTAHLRPPDTTKSSCTYDLQPEQ